MTIQRFKCWLGFHRWVYNADQGRECSFCGRRERFVLVDFGRTKEWVIEYKAPSKRL